MFPEQSLINGLLCMKNLHNTGVVLPWGKLWLGIRRHDNEGPSVVCFATLSSLLHAVLN